MKLLLQNLTKIYARKCVFSIPDLELPSGAVVVLLGSNGAGKTTLLKLLSAMTVPTSGQVLVDGEILVRPRLDLRRRLCFVADFPQFYHYTLMETLALHLRLWETPLDGMEQRVASILERLGILPQVHQSLHSLSRGERYKVALTCLLATNPELWLLDEPFASGMDPRGLGVLRQEMLEAAHGGGRTVIYSTQLLEVACSCSDYIAMFRNGSLSLHATEAEFGRDPRRLEQLFSSENPA